jgi:hypothetical protein
VLGRERESNAEQDGISDTAWSSAQPTSPGATSPELSAHDVWTGQIKYWDNRRMLRQKEGTD